MERTAGDSRPVLVRTSALVALASVMTAALAVAATLTLRPPDATPRPGAFAALAGTLALEPLPRTASPTVPAGQNPAGRPTVTTVERSGAGEAATTSVAGRAATARAATGRAAPERAATTRAAAPASAGAATAAFTAALAGGSNAAAQGQEEPLGSGRSASAAAEMTDGEPVGDLTGAGAVDGPSTSEPVVAEPVVAEPVVAEPVVAEAAPTGQPLAPPSQSGPSTAPAPCGLPAPAGPDRS